MFLTLTMSAPFSSTRTMTDPTDYKSLFLKAEEERRKEAELHTTRILGREC